MTDQDGARLITAERRRQVEAEGWTLEHDDNNHDNGDLAMAAACYAAASAYQRLFVRDDSGSVVSFRDPWPADWEDKRRKAQGHRSRVRMLVKAGALIAAEIDRLQRERLAVEAGEASTQDTGTVVSERKP